jgi:hypothetical protein
MLAFVVLSMVTGCAVRSAQWENLRRLAVIDGADEAAEYAWIFEFNGAGYQVYPISDNNGLVTFANADGLRVSWDGVLMNSVDGLPGATGRLRIETGSEGSRKYPLGSGEYRALFCTPRRNWQLTPERAGWRQDCFGRNSDSDVTAVHEVEFDANGAIRVVRGTLILGAPPAILTRLMP